MALSLEDQHRVVFALCLPGRILDNTSMDYNSIVFDHLQLNNQFIEARVVSILDDIDTIKTQLKASPKNANLKRIGDIELDTDRSHLLIKKEYSRLLEELSKLLDIPCRCRAGGGKNVCVVL